MTKLDPSRLRAFVDHLAGRGVSRLSVRQGADRIDLVLESGYDAAAVPDAPAPNFGPNSGPNLAPATLRVTSPGPGVFHRAHPAAPDAPACLQSGHFLFPVDLPDGARVVAPDLSVVGYGTVIATAGDTE